MVVPQSEAGGKLCSTEASDSSEGREKEGNGCGVNLFTALKSAMKQAFYKDSGLRKAVNVSWAGRGVGVKNESRCSAPKRFFVSKVSGRWKRGGVNFEMEDERVDGTYLSQM